MSQNDRISVLKARHHSLEEAIKDKERQPNVDNAEIHTLKKEKLHIKDQLANHFAT